MIICHDRKFVFVHVPKNGGTSIRKLIKEAVPNSTQYQAQVVRLPITGEEADLSHLTMKQVRVNYPDIFDILLAFESFCIVRCPQSRFKSAMAQYITNYLCDELASYNSAHLDDVAKNICSKLSGSHNESRSVELVHFVPQVEFIFDQGVQVVEHLFCLEDGLAIDDFLRLRLGALGSFREVKENQKTMVKEGYLYTSVALLARFLPTSWVSSSIRKYLKNLYRKPIDAVSDIPFNDWIASSEIRAFCNDFYAEDFTLYKTVQFVRKKELANFNET